VQRKQDTSTKAIKEYDMNKIKLFWARLEKAAWARCEVLHSMTGFNYRAVKQDNGYSVQAYSPATGKWYHIEMVTKA